MRARVPLLVLLLAPALFASPLVFSDVDPVLQELFDDGSSTKGFAKQTKQHLMVPEDYHSNTNRRLDESDDFSYDDYEDLRSEGKRSGLRAAMVARGGRGVVMRPGWQVGGDPVAPSGAEPDIGGLIARRSQQPASPYLSVGVLSNVEQYFNGLRDQLETIADQPSVIQTHSHGILREGPRPSATAAYLHALRSHRPSHRVRSFVEDPGPVELRGANSHDPALLWTGLGRR